MDESNLKHAIKEAGLLYKEVAEKVGYPTNRVSADASCSRVSAENAIRYSRALGIDPATLRPDIFQPGEVRLCPPPQ